MLPSSIPKTVNPWLVFFGALFAVLGAIYACTKYIVASETAEVKHDISSARDDIIKLRDDVQRTNKRIDDALTDALNKIVGQAKGQAKNSKATIQAGANVLSIAQRADAHIDPVALKRYGEIVTAASKEAATSDIAWANITKLVNYRSFLNASYVIMPSDLTEVDTKFFPYKFTLAVRPGHPAPRRSFTLDYAGGPATDQESARLEALDNPQRGGSGSKLFVIEGSGSDDALVLDGEYMKNVIIRNAVVIYDGGPVKLENVYFVHCTFVLKRTTPVLDFGNTILQAESVTFSTVHPA